MVKHNTTCVQCLCVTYWYLNFSMISRCVYDINGLHYIHGPYEYWCTCNGDKYNYSDIPMRCTPWPDSMMNLFYDFGNSFLVCHL